MTYDGVLCTYVLCLLTITNATAAGKEGTITVKQSINNDIMRQKFIGFRSDCYLRIV